MGAAVLTEVARDGTAALDAAGRSEAAPSGLLPGRSVPLAGAMGLDCGTGLDCGAGLDCATGRDCAAGVDCAVGLG